MGLEEAAEVEAVAEARVSSQLSVAAVPVMGLRVFSGTMEDLAAVLRQMLRSEAARHVVTLNPEIYMATRRDSEFRQAVMEADLLLPDGIGIVWASRLLGNPVAERLAGVETVDLLCAICARERLGIYLLGGGTGIAARAASELQHRHPGLLVAGAEEGDPHPDRQDAIVSRINNSGAAVLLVAFGAPKQELWIWRNKRNLSARVAVGVGGTFDFLAGVVPRAPRSWQRLGLEWLWRLIHQPWRWRRMLALPHFAALVLASAVTRRLR